MIKVIGDRVGQAEAYNVLGNLFFFLAEYDKADECVKKEL